jgi:hypothetical protein
LPVPRTLPGLTPSRRRGLKSNSPTREIQTILGYH